MNYETFFQKFLATDIKKLITIFIKIIIYNLYKNNKTDQYTSELKKSALHSP